MQLLLLERFPMEMSNRTMTLIRRAYNKVNCIEIPASIEHTILSHSRIRFFKDCFALEFKNFDQIRDNL